MAADRHARIDIAVPGAASARSDPAQVHRPRARWNDFIYTVPHRIGLFSVLIFFTLRSAAR
jgi:hypothetical protein